MATCYDNDDTAPLAPVISSMPPTPADDWYHGAFTALGRLISLASVRVSALLRLSTSQTKTYGANVARQFEAGSGSASPALVNRQINR